MIGLPSNLEIVVVGNKRKEIITTNYLKDIPHRIFYTTDYTLPKDFKINKEFEKYRSAAKHQLGAYRCFCGHQDALKSCTKDYILIFEDDAVPKTHNWISFLTPAIELLTTFDVVSLHGREVKLERFNSIVRHNSIFYHKKDFVKQNENWVLGALSYLVKKDLIKKIEGQQYIGNPWDLYLCNDFKFCFLYPSPFHHDRRKGSLVENKKKVKEKRY